MSCGLALLGNDPSGVAAPTGRAVRFPAYVANITYSANTYVAGSDANVYHSLATTTGNDPTVDDGKNWDLAIVKSDTELAVPSRFATLGAAWKFLQNAFMGQGRRITIKFADGTYNFGSQRFVLDHPQGSQIGS